MRSAILDCAARLPAASRVWRQASDAAKSAQPQVQPPPNRKPTRNRSMK
jgi:hypothetical protein